MRAMIFARTYGLMQSRGLFKRAKALEFCASRRGSSAIHSSRATRFLQGMTSVVATPGRWVLWIAEVQGRLCPRQRQTEVDDEACR